MRGVGGGQWGGQRGAPRAPTCPQVELMSFQLASMRARKRSPNTSEQTMTEPARLSGKVGSKGWPGGDTGGGGT